MRQLFFFAVLGVVLLPPVKAYLEVDGEDLLYKGQKVFLSGVNLAWNAYGYDFGDGNYYINSKATYEQWIDEISAAGGNSMRFWLHVEGQVTPAFGGDGYVTGLDREGTAVQELLDCLDYAASKNVFVIPALWNGAAISNQNAVNVVNDEAILTSYLENALRPLVEGIGGHRALAAWDIINEFEGSVMPYDPGSGNPCFDSNPMSGQGAGWTGKSIPLENYLRFINRQAGLIRELYPDAIISAGAWRGGVSNTEVCTDGQCFNYYKNECLVAAGGNELGYLDLYQMHTYSDGDQYHQLSPMIQEAAYFQLDKPNVVGEFSSGECGAGMTTEDQFGWAYTHGYAGAWSWQYNAGGGCSDTQETQRRGMAYLKTIEDPENYGLISIIIE